jgi:phenylacetate-CoA ligase
LTNFPRLLSNLFWAMKRARWKKEKLRLYQEKCLRSTLKYAYDFVPFYHRKFREEGILPSAIRTLADLKKLPIIRKDELRKRNSELVSVQQCRQNLRLVRTSGSTGQPFELFLNKMEDDWRKSIYMRANLSCGQRPRDSWVVITNPRHFWETTNIQRTLGIYSQRCVSLFLDIQKQIELVEKAKPDVLDGYSGSLHLLAKAINENSSVIKPKMIFGSSELIDSPSMNYIEKVFNAPYYDQFGCVEVDRTAWMCPEKVGYHMDVDSVITEFVDDEGNEFSCGESGEIVYTSLFNRAMPFIRYAIGDVGVASDEECPCGRTLPLMKVIEGRKDSLLLLPNGGVLSPRTFSVAMSMFSSYNLIERFRVIQKKRDYIKIYLKIKDKDADVRFLERDLISHLWKMLNIESDQLNLEIDLVDEIPVAKGGKLNAIVSELPSNNFN